MSSFHLDMRKLFRLPRSVSGYAFMQKLRRSNIQVPAIALTAYARRGDVEEALAAGFQAYLAKPVRPSDLVAAVASLSALPPIA